MGVLTFLMDRYIFGKPIFRMNPIYNNDVL